MLTRAPSSRRRAGARPPNADAAVEGAIRLHDVPNVGVSESVPERCRGRVIMQVTKSAPRARGDGPIKVVRRHRCPGCSPRPRGWFPGQGGSPGGPGVLPAPAGMVPHGPPFAGVHGCSPRPRGWSRCRCAPGAARRVLPAPAGMDPDRDAAVAVGVDCCGRCVRWWPARCSVAGWRGRLWGRVGLRRLRRSCRRRREAAFGWVLGSGATRLSAGVADRCGVLGLHPVAHGLVLSNAYRSSVGQRYAFEGGVETRTGRCCGPGKRVPVPGADHGRGWTRTSLAGR